jgi:hypothetical protein
MRFARMNPRDYSRAEPEALLRQLEELLDRARLAEAR